MAITAFPLIGEVMEGRPIPNLDSRAESPGGSVMMSEEVQDSFQILRTIIGTHHPGGNPDRFVLLDKHGVRFSESMPATIRPRRNPSRAEIADVLRIAVDEAFFSLRDTYQWGGSGAGGEKLMIAVRGLSHEVTVWGTHHWAATEGGWVSKELRELYGDEVMRFIKTLDRFSTAVGMATYR